MAHALGIDRQTLLLGRLDDVAPAGFAPLLARRLVQEPVAYITGARDFWSISLKVGPGVLIPRPDSETLIEAAADHFKGRSPARILDLGTGPGTLLLAALAEFPQATGLGVDQSDVALSYARQNAEGLGLADRAQFQSGDWAEGLLGQFDLILCNPPYVEEGADLAVQILDHEPHGALFAGSDGLDDYRRIAPQLPSLLAKYGLALIEIGADQAHVATALFEAQGFAVRVVQDLGGRDRCLSLER